MKLLEFTHDLTWDGLPLSVQNQARRCLLDVVGAALGGRQTELSHIIHDFAAAMYGGAEARLWFDGRPVSPPGAALANGMTVDALDIHDGYTLVKGHAGAALVPATLATASLSRAPLLSGAMLLTALVMGYELALRAGLALHATACDYHTSGAWNALGCAAITARRLGSNSEQTRHALGIAEYHGPRSQMMRCIDAPTMVKDGSGWGAMAGVSAALLAHAGFTGAPAMTIEGSEVAHIWADLGQRWLILEQYFKPHAVCRWAQPAIEGALALKRRYDLVPAQIEQIRISTFHEATRLACQHPQTTEEAQYSLPFPVAAALVHGQLGPAELSGSALQSAPVLNLARRVELIEEAAFNSRFPAERLARVRIETGSGQVFDSGDVQAEWDMATPPTDDELQRKFGWLAKTFLAETSAARLELALWHCADLPDVTELLALIITPPAR